MLHTTYPFGGTVQSIVPLDNTLRLMLADATVSVVSHGDATIDGIKAYAVQNVSGGITFITDLYAANFYSPNAGVSVVADGSLTLEQVATPCQSPTRRPE